MEIVKSLLQELFDTIIAELIECEAIDSELQQRGIDATNNNENETQTFPLVPVVQSHVLAQRALRLGHFYQLRTLEQINNGSCGYYVLHFANVCTQASRCEDVALRARVMMLLVNRTSFWRYYARSIRIILAEAERHDNRTKWPWSRSSILGGVLERSYLPYVVGDPSSAVGGDHCSYVHYGYAHFANSMTQLKAIQKAVDQIRSHVGVHVFAMGILSHWTCLIINHTSIGSIEVVYLDSYNRPVLDVTDEDVDKYVLDVLAERASLGKPELPTWQQKIMRQTRADCALSVRDMLRCWDGDDLREMALTSLVERMLSSYFEHASMTEFNGTTLFGDQSDLYVIKLTHWLENYWHPSVLRDSFVNELSMHGLTFVRKELVVRLHKWCTFHIHAEQSTSLSIDLIAAFFKVVKSLYFLVENHLVVSESISSEL